MHQLAQRALLTLSLTLAGCQSHNPAPVAFYNKGPESTLPAISVFINKPSDDLEKFCSERSCTQDPRIVERVYAELQRSNVFASVRAGNVETSEYAVHISLRRFDTDDTAESLTKAVVAGATLLLVPVSLQAEYRSEFVVTWRNIKIAEYAFTTQFDHKISIYDDPLKQLDFVAESITSQFIAATQGSAVFQAEHIYASLKADDYHNDLKPPVQIGNYRHKDFLLYPDPLLGAQVRYEHTSAAQQIVDVFIYPIRKTDWSDTSETAASELDTAIKDIDLAVKAGTYTSAKLATPSPVTLNVNEKPHSGWMTSGNLEGKNSRATKDFLYVFLAKDKYLKFRISVPADSTVEDVAEIEKFVIGFVQEVQVPEESFFMASLRQKLRNSTIK